MQLLASVFYTAFFFIWTLCYATFFVLVAPLVPFPSRFALARFWAQVLLTVLRWTCRLDYVVEGRENLPGGNHIALWKHSSAWETIAMGVVFPRQVWVLKHELLWVPVVGWCIRLLHAIAINRRSGQSAVGQVVEQGKQRLAEGDWIMIFPEGTRMPPGQTRKYGVSGAVLASETGRLVVPVAHNAGYFWPRRGMRKKPGTVQVHIGPPIDSAGRTAREINELAQSWIESRLRQIAPRNGSDAGANIDVGGDQQTAKN